MTPVEVARQGCWRRLKNVVFTSTGVFILGALTIGVISWLVLFPSYGPAVLTDGLQSAKVTVSANGSTTTLNAASALTVANAINSLPRSGRRDGCQAMDTGSVNTVVFQADAMTTVIIDTGGCLDATVTPGSDQWVLDDSSGSANATIDRALQHATS